MLGLFSRGGRASRTDEEPSTDYPSGPRAPERPPLPRPEGLNRSALTIAAVIMGTVVIAAVVFIQPSRPIVLPAGNPGRTPPLNQGTFLDQPPAQAVRQGTESTSSVDSTSVAAQQRTQRSTSVTQPATLDSPYAQPVMPAPDAAQAERLEAFRSGLSAPVRSNAITLADLPDASRRAGDLTQPADEGGEPATRVPLTVPAPSRPSEEPNPPAPRPKSEQLSATRVVVDSAPSPFAVQAGTLIPAVLITEINSDLPGQVLAQVARDVYDTRSQQALLVPKGAKLIGSYEDQVPIGRDRLLVAWTRILLPDGRSVSLPGLPTKDRAGAGGISDRVDRHARRTFGTTALLSLIGAGLQLSQPRGAVGLGGYYPSAGQIAAGAVGQQLAEVAAQLLKRDLDARPTVRIGQGLQFNVFLNTDLVFQQPYNDRR